MRESFENGWAQASAMFMTFVPKLLLAAVILVAGYFIAKAICRLMSGALEKLGFNRLVERGGIRRSLEGSGWDASTILSKVVFYFVMLFVLQLAFGVFGPNPVSEILNEIIAFLPNVFVAVVIVMLTAAFAAAAKQLIRATLGGFSYGSFLASAAGAAILVVGITAALNQLQIAPAIVNGLFYAMLAAIVGVTIVAVGGGGIAPMRARWERALNRVGEEVPKLQQVTPGAGAHGQAGAAAWNSPGQMPGSPPATPQPPAVGSAPGAVPNAGPAAIPDNPAPQPGANAEPPSRFVERRPPPSRRRDPGEGI